MGVWSLCGPAPTQSMLTDAGHAQVVAGKDAKLIKLIAAQAAQMGLPIEATVPSKSAKAYNEDTEKWGKRTIKYQVRPSRAGGRW